MMYLSEITRFLDELLHVHAIPDAAVNGLQVGRDQEITKIALAVDACMDSFREAKKQGAQLLITHHGVSYGNSLSTIRSLNYERLQFLLKHSIAVYTAHLPLDAHPDVGNNIQLFKALKLQKPRQFGYASGVPIGLIGSVKSQTQEEFIGSVNGLLDVQAKLWDFGPEHIKNVAVVSGRGSAFLREAIESGADTYVTGELTHDDYHIAKDGGINVILAGHHATETLGLKALQPLIEQTFKIPTVFLNLDSGL